MTSSATLPTSAPPSISQFARGPGRIRKPARGSARREVVGGADTALQQRPGLGQYAAAAVVGAPRRCPA